MTDPVVFIKKHYTVIIASFLISLSLNSYWYFSKKNLYEYLATQGDTAQIYSKYLGSDGSPWYYGVPVRDYYFVSKSGDTIKGREKTAMPGYVSSIFYRPNGLAIYKADDPGKFLLTDEIETYPYSNSFSMYYLAGLPFMTVWITAMFIILSKVLRRFTAKKELGKETLP